MKSVENDNSAFAELYMHYLNEHGSPISCLCRFGRFRYQRQEGGEGARCDCVVLYREGGFGRVVDVRGGLGGF